MSTGQKHQRQKLDFWLRQESRWLTDWQKAVADCQGVPYKAFLFLTLLFPLDESLGQEGDWIDLKLTSHNWSWNGDSCMTVSPHVKQSHLLSHTFSWALSILVRKTEIYGVSLCHPRGQLWRKSWQSFPPFSGRKWPFFGEKNSQFWQQQKRLNWKKLFLL